MSPRGSGHNVMSWANTMSQGWLGHSTIPQKSSTGASDLEAGLCLGRGDCNVCSRESRQRLRPVQTETEAAGAETQTGSGLSLSESGFHWPLLALSRVILRLRVNIGSGSYTQTHYRHSVLGPGRLMLTSPRPTSARVSRRILGSSSDSGVRL